jgi:outer membrane protease
VKNIAFFFCFVIIFYAICPQIYGEDAKEKKQFPYALSVTNGAGFLYGYGEEIVYKTLDSYLSQLTWDIKPLFYYESALAFSRIDLFENFGFFSELSLKFGFPAKTGDIEDKDWLPEGGGNLTNYSCSENYTDRALLLDLSLGISIPIKAFAVIKLFVGISWMQFQWTGRDGYYQYPYRTPASGPTEGTFSGPIIGYSQNWLLLYPGISVLYPVLKWFTMEYFVQTGPFTLGTDRDDHFGTNMEYSDYVKWNFYIEPGCTFIFFPYKNIETALRVSYRYIGTTPGETYYRHTGKNMDEEYQLSSTPAGMAFHALDISLLFTVHFPL